MGSYATQRGVTNHIREIGKVVVLEIEIAKSREQRKLCWERRKAVTPQRYSTMGD